jgi:hypothetical protein
MERTTKTTSSKKMNRPALLVLLVLLSSSLLGISACTDEQKEQVEYKTMERKRTAAEKAVRARADLYWELIRWKDWDRASRFFEKPEDQLSFVRQVSGVAVRHPTRDEIKVQFVFVASDALEQAQLRIGWTEVVAVAGSVQTRVVEQRWYKAQGTWWARAALPFGLEVGRVGEPGSDPEGIDEAPPEDLPSSTGAAASPAAPVEDSAP